jgi:hypothetical protein
VRPALRTCNLHERALDCTGGALVRYDPLAVEH